MAKKSVIKGDSEKINIQKNINPNKLLVENFVALQKVMTNLSIKFDNLSDQISKLLELFEISAKALAEKEFQAEKGDKNSKKILEKIDNLLEQNKIIARGVALIHEKESSEPQRIPSPMQRFPPQQMQPINPVQKETPNYEESINKFQKSIASKR